MSYIPLEALLKNHDSYFKLVLTAAERANEILNGSKSLIVTHRKKHTAIALEEVAAGKVSYVQNSENK